MPFYWYIRITISQIVHLRNFPINLFPPCILFDCLKCTKILQSINSVRIFNPVTRILQTVTTLIGQCKITIADSIDFIWNIIIIIKTKSRSGFPIRYLSECVSGEEL